MNRFKLFTVLIAGIFSIQLSFAQATIKEETVEVYGNCGMCKKTIESSAKSAGASFANWNSKTRQLNISYDSTITSGFKIQEAVANSGYDTNDFKGSDGAYNHLPDCCKYDRKQLANPKK